MISRHMPTGHNDLWASENKPSATRSFLHETSFDNLHKRIFFDTFDFLAWEYIYIYTYIYIYIMKYMIVYVYKIHSKTMHGLSVYVPLETISWQSRQRVLAKREAEKKQRLEEQEQRDWAEGSEKNGTSDQNGSDITWLNISKEF